MIENPDPDRGPVLPPTGVVGGSVTTTPGDSFTTPQSQSQQPGLGAYDVWSDQAFGGPTDAEQQIFQATYGIGAQQGPQWQQAYKLMGDAGERATAGLDPTLGNAMIASEKQYAGQDPSAAALDPQLQAYLSMVGPQGGYDAATKAAIANEGNAALNAQEASARDQINNARARTGSPVGAYGAIADVSQNIGNQRSAQARQNQILFANEKERQREAGAQGLGSNAGLTLGRENAAMQSFLASQGQRFGQQQTAANQAEQFLNDATSRQLAGLNSAAGQAAQQRAYQQAGGAGLTNLLQGQMGQQTQLYSLLANLLGNKQGDEALANTLGADFQVS